VGSGSGGAAAVIDELAYATLPSPFGDVLAVGHRGGVVRLAFPEEPPERVLPEIARATGVRPVAGARRFRNLAAELERFFDGTGRRFSTRVDLRLVEGRFQRRVLEAAARIPYGSVATYGDLARRAGSPRAGRAAGSAMRRNPVPILIPCHRVLPADGSLGGYAGYEHRKAMLLELEARAGTTVAGRDAGRATVPRDPARATARRRARA
jgi:methylated-DNA-[protein]-cysteine S-methyltransferase